MKKFSSIFLPLFLLPFITHAAGDLQTFLTAIISFIDSYIIPFLLGIAFLFFVINAIRFFVIEGHDEDGRRKARALALYSVSAFVLIVVFWGVVNMLVRSIGAGGCEAPQSDYFLKHFVGPMAPGC